MADEEYEIELDRLTAGYDGQPLIENLSVAFRKGEVVVLIGPNGAGKSTVLKSIARQLAWIGGRVVCEGKNIGEMSYAELSEHLAVVLTDRIRPEKMTCREVAAAGRYPYTGRLGKLTPEDERKTDEAIRAVHAEEIQDRDFEAVSDGQRQRIMLARAFCQEPDVLVLDEPTSFLDIRYKLELLTILRQMAKEKGITVIMSLHEIDLAMKIADLVICVDHGHTVSADAPEKIFTEDSIRKLFRVEDGFFDPLSGGIEMPAPAGEPEVFVISSGGSGIPVFRKLQRENTPFAAGVLFTNDIDYPLAKRLASEVVTAEPFREIPDSCIGQASEIMDRCRRVINVCRTFGPDNRKMEQLIRKAAEEGKLS